MRDVCIYVGGSKIKSSELSPESREKIGIYENNEVIENPAIKKQDEKIEYNKRRDKVSAKRKKSKNTIGMMLLKWLNQKSR